MFGSSPTYLHLCLIFQGWRKRTNPPNEIQEALLRGGISKERSLGMIVIRLKNILNISIFYFTAFSDGVFSIVATLLVLDIT